MARPCRTPNHGRPAGSSAYLRSRIPRASPQSTGYFTCPIWVCRLPGAIGKGCSSRPETTFQGPSRNRFTVAVVYGLLYPRLIGWRSPLRFGAGEPGRTHGTYRSARPASNRRPSPIGMNRRNPAVRDGVERIDTRSEEAPATDGCFGLLECRMRRLQSILRKTRCRSTGRGDGSGSSCARFQPLPCWWP